MNGGTRVNRGRRRRTRKRTRRRTRRRARRGGSLASPETASQAGWAVDRQQAGSRRSSSPTHSAQCGQPAQPSPVVPSRQARPIYGSQVMHITGTALPRPVPFQPLMFASRRRSSLHRQAQDTSVSSAFRGLSASPLFLVLSTSICW